MNKMHMHGASLIWWNLCSMLLDHVLDIPHFRRLELKHHVLAALHSVHNVAWAQASLRSAALQTKWRLLVFLPSFLWRCRRSWCTRCLLRSARKSKCRPFRCSFHPRWRSRAAEVIDDCSAAVISLAIPKSLVLTAPSFPSRMFDGFAVDYSAAADVLHAFCDLVECDDKIDSAGPANEASQFLLYALRSLLWDWKLESFDIRFLLLRMRFHLRELALFLQA